MKKTFLKTKIHSVPKAFAFVYALMLICCIVVGCTDKSQENTSPGANKNADVYFFNFKPEIADVYDDIAREYKEKTGVNVKVVTASSGTYEETLRSEIAKSNAPTIFQINGPTGYENWKDYCKDLSDSKLYDMLSDKSVALTSGDGVYGIPYVIEGYGIIYNDAIMQKYFKTEGAVVTSADEIHDFDTLREVVEDMTAKKEELQIDGVFASTSMAAGNQWRWQSHLANIPFYYELRENQKYDNTVLAGLNTKEIQFKYHENFKDVFDLYINNSVSAPGLLSSVTVDQSMAEFALGKCAMVQNGNWGAEQILEVSGNTVDDDDIKFLPIYTGVEGEENQGLCIGTENYLCINANATEAQQQASIDFLVWLFSSEDGKEYVTDELGFLTPFNTFEPDELPDDPLAKEVLRWMNKEGIESIPWTFASFPSDEFKNRFGDALLEYTQGQKSWEDVVSAVKQTWSEEYTGN